MYWKIVAHKDLSIVETLQIANLKNQHWQYDLDSQIQWMQDNLFDDDKHLMGIEQNGNRQLLKAYVTLTNIHSKIDEQSYEFVGVGNVCVDRDYRHLGIGQNLMTEAIQYIKKQCKNGILLCKDSLIPFYEKCGWKLLRYENACVADRPYKHNIMVFDKTCSCNSIKLDRNF